jgi:hypothetical protein
MVMNSEKEQFPGQVGDSKVTILDKQYDWGIYFWKKANGKPFTDGHGNVLNIPSHRGDALQIHKLVQEATALGQGDGSYEFMPGVSRVSDEEYSEQVDRMKQGLIPNLNDIGAVMAAKETFDKYGSDD